MSTQYNNQDVYRLATDGNYDELKTALNQNNNSTNWYANPSGYTPLHVSAHNGHEKCLKLLLEKGISVISKISLGYTAQHLAAANGHIRCLQLLLDTLKVNVDENLNVFGLTALQCASREGHRDCVELLLDYNADISFKSSRTGKTSLHLASMENRHQCIRLLVDRGIDINHKANDGETALIDAAGRGHKKCIEILLELGAAIDDDIEKYFPKGNPYHPEITDITDCRPMILAEVEHRRKRSIFDSFINHHIEYKPYISNIYTLCYPTGNLRVAKPSIGWENAEAFRDVNYFDEVFFHLHMVISNFYSNKRPGAIVNSLMSSSSDYFAGNSDKTSTLMTVLTDRLKLMLKPNDLQ